MASRLFDDRSRLIGIAGAVLLHVVAIALLILFAPDYVPLPRAPKPALVAVDLTPPPPPSPPRPDDVEQGASAPPSRGTTAAPSPPPPPRPLATPTPAPPAPDPGSQQASGLG